MSLVAVGSAKGSPGVTTMVAALAARWPDDRPLLVAEADPAGGDLAPRLGLGAEPGLMTLAADGRRDLTTELLWQQVQALPGSTSSHVLTGPASAEQASAALSTLSARLAWLLAALDGVDVIADCGRLDPRSPAMALVRAADLVVLVARSSASQLHHLSTRVQALGSAVPVALVLIGDRPYDVVEAGRAVGAEPLGAIADDARAADLLTAGNLGRSRLLRASGLLRTARTVAEQLAARLGPRTAAVDAQPTVPDALASPPMEPAPEPEPMASEPESAPAQPQPQPEPEMVSSPTSAGPPRPRGRRTVRSRPLQARPHPSGPDASSVGAPPAPVPPEALR